MDEKIIKGGLDIGNKNLKVCGSENNAHEIPVAYEEVSKYDYDIERFWKHRDEDDLCQYICINYQYTKDRKNNSNMYGYLKTCVENDYANAIPQILLDYKLL